VAMGKEVVVGGDVLGTDEEGGDRSTHGPVMRDNEDVIGRIRLANFVGELHAPRYPHASSG